MIANLPSDDSRTRIQTLLGHEFFAPSLWRRRVALWLGGILVGLAAIFFSEAADAAYGVFKRLLAISPYVPLLLTPVVFGLLAWLTRGVMRPTRGSGIPQVIASLSVEDAAFRKRLLSLPVAAGKMVLTLIALVGGAAVGREGPTVHVGAGVMYWLGRRFGFSDPTQISRFVLAGGGAGIAAAFNTPLAGVVFAIEELAGTFEHRFSGIILTAVIFAGVVSLGILGDYSYFGIVDTTLPLGPAWFAVLACAVCGGLGGGLFSRLIILSDHGPLAKLAAFRKRAPVSFAFGCGLLLAILGVTSGSVVYGTGYEQAQGLIDTTHSAAASFGLAKLAANLLSQWAGLPGGIFSPALAVGAGMGHTLSAIVTSAPAAAVVLLGMAAFLSGVTQTPITAAVISLELTNNHSMVISIMAVCLLSRAISSLVCPVPVYRALANGIIAEYEQQKEDDEARIAAASGEASAAEFVADSLKESGSPPPDDPRGEPR